MLAYNPDDLFDPQSPSSERKAHSYKLSSIHYISAMVYAHVYTQTHTEINKSKMKEQEEKKKKNLSLNTGPAVAEQTFNPSIWGQRKEDIFAFKANLIYMET